MKTIGILIEKGSGEYDSVKAKYLYIGEKVITITLLTGEEIEYETADVKGLAAFYEDRTEWIPGGYNDHV